MSSISYAITACNEHVELERLLNMLYLNIKESDEIVVQLDINATDEVKKIVSKPDPNVVPFKVVEFGLNNDFASFKNNLSKHCTKEYIFQIDADEYPHPHLISSLPEILDYNSTVDVFLTPRINTVEGLTEQHIKQWGWNVNDKGWVNFPDYQWRIWKNSNKIKWINKVHERLDGFNEYSALPQLEEYCLFHPKDIKRQEKQNAFYDQI
jgi:cellulose synthase/poly-beta-1,6-N-acetylglucosamine synthase-like glycosyltransferase